MEEVDLRHAHIIKNLNGYLAPSDVFVKILLYHSPTQLEKYGRRNHCQVLVSRLLYELFQIEFRPLMVKLFEKRKKDQDEEDGKLH